MAITEVAYCTREMVQRALNLADTPRLNGRVDAAIMAGARQVEGLLHRRFYPNMQTRSFDLPADYTLWLYEHELAASPTVITTGGNAMTPNVDYILRPRQGPPWRWIDQTYTAAVPFQPLASGDQNAISITGDFGYPTTTLATTTIGSAAGSTAATILLNDSSVVGVGSLILVDLERMIVTDKAMSTTTCTITADLTNQKLGNTVTVSSGTLIQPGEMILIDSERMQVEYVAGNVLTVDRAVNGSTLATHSNGALIYAARTASVLRGVLGSAAASHGSGAGVSLLAAPSLIGELNLAYAINNNQAALSAYSRISGPESISAYRDRGRGIAELEQDAYQAYGRKMRTRAVGS